METQTVTTRAILRGSIRKAFAWDIITDFEHYNDIMDNIDSIVIHERTETGGRSEWSVMVEDAPLTWIENDFFDHENFEVRFESIGGDFETISGVWRIDDFENRGIVIDFQVNYKLGIPVIEEVLGDILRGKMKRNIDSMLAAIKNKLESVQHDEREYPRLPVGHYTTLRVDQESVRAYVVNISAGGMMFYFTDELEPSSFTMRIGPVSIDVQELYTDMRHKHCRLLFNRELSTDELENAVNYMCTEHNREYERIYLDTTCTLNFGSGSLTVFVVNISQLGMLCRYRGRFPVSDEREMEIQGRIIPLNGIDNNVNRKLLRIEFASRLAQSEFYDIVQRLSKNRLDVSQVMLPLDA